MMGSGFFTFEKADLASVSLVIKQDNRINFQPIVEEWRKLTGEERNEISYDFTLNVTAIITGMAHGKIDCLLERMPDLIMERHSPMRSNRQHRTLRGIEYFMFWVQTGRKPMTGETENYHSALLEMFAPIVRIPNPLISSEIVIHRKSTSEMNTREMSVMVDGALAMLMTMDIPKVVADAVGIGMKKLWHEWYEWKNSHRMLKLRDDAITWDQYREIYPYCELCGLGDKAGDPLERMHIVSGGSDIVDYEKSWNWLHSHHSHHAIQHGSVKDQLAGWNLIVTIFPHIRARVERAFALGHKKAFVWMPKIIS